jgi:glycosyltransferase involved in cell wall biosynthesis
MIQRRRIAMIIARYPPYVGGAEKQCERLSRALVKAGCQVTVLTETRIRAHAGLRIESGVRVHRIYAGGSETSSSPIFLLKLFIQLLIGGSFDVLHAHILSAPALVAAVAGKLRSTPILIKIAGARASGDLALSKSSGLGRFKIWLVRAVQANFVCPDPQTAIEARTVFPPERVHALSNGVDTEYFQPAQPGQQAAERERLGLQGRTRWAIYSGRWAPGKGVERLLEVFGPHADGWGLILVLADRRRVAVASKHVHVFYEITDVLPYYQAADLAVLLSEGEGLSNFLLEAMACGLPLLTTEAAAVGAPAERTAWQWTVPSGADAGAVAHQLSQLFQDPALPEKGAAARKKAESDFALSLTALHYRDLYRSLR